MQQVATITGGLLGAGVPGAGEVVVRGVSTDSRQTRAGELFVALKGERFDGHDFVEAAEEKGAAGAVVERSVPCALPQVVVEDALRALGELGRWWREAHAVTVVAVTGSAGKTTTKGMTAAILQRRAPCLSNPGSENNEIGLPRTLLKLSDEEYCVLEMGARGLGQIEYLARIAQPKIGVITNIGEAHVGLLGGREKIAQAKSELLLALPEEGTAVLNRDDYFFGLLSEMAPCRVLSFGLGQGDFRAEDVQVSPEGTDFVLVGPGGRRPVHLNLPGKHHVANALAAAAAAWAAGARGPDLVEGLEAFEGEAMRTQILRRPDGVTVINDAYNASPTSVAAALELLASLEGRKVFVFGDMLELGEEAEEAHRTVGDQARRAGVEVLVAVGDLGRLAGERAEALGLQVLYAEDAQQASETVPGLVRGGDLVLVKASRAVGLECVAESLMGGEARS